MRRHRISLTLMSLAIAGCATVQSVMPLKADYSTVPEDALRSLAREIEREVSRGNRDFAPKQRDGLVLDTPEIKQALRVRAARAQLVSGLLDTGHAWERNNGLVSIIRTGAYKRATTPQIRDRNALLVMNENQNRWALYEGIVNASGFAPSALDAVQALFFEARQQSLQSGQAYEGSDGKPVSK